MDAQWHAPDDLPMIPPGMSIARRIIDDWVANGLANSSDSRRQRLQAVGMATHWKVEPLDLDNADDASEGGVPARGAALPQRGHSRRRSSCPTTSCGTRSLNIHAEATRSTTGACGTTTARICSASRACRWEDYEDNRELSLHRARRHAPGPPPEGRRGARSGRPSSSRKDGGRPLVGFDANDKLPAGWDFLKAHRRRAQTHRPLLDVEVRRRRPAATRRLGGPRR